MKTIKKILTHMAIYYTVAAGLYSFVIFAMYSNAEGGALLSAERVFLLLPFCLCFAAANCALTAKSLPRGLGYPLHCAATMLGIYLCVLLPAELSGSQRLVGFMTALVIYIVVMVLYSLLAAHIKKTVREERNYREATQNSNKDQAQK